MRALIQPTATARKMEMMRMAQGEIPHNSPTASDSFCRFRLWQIGKKRQECRPDWPSAVSFSLRAS